MSEKWFQIYDKNDGLSRGRPTPVESTALLERDNEQEVKPIYVLTAEEWAKWRALYSAINDVVNHCGAVGSIEARGDRMWALVDALYKIDGGTYDEKLSGKEVRT